VDVAEEFLGSNETGFVLLRTESDNQGSYYTTRIKRYLDEYVKLPTREGYSLVIAKKQTSTLLLDVAYSQDPDGVRSETLHFEDSQVSLSAILKKYPTRGSRWTAEQRGKLRSPSNELAIYAGNLCIVSNWELTTEIFGFESGKVEAHLDAVLEDMNCIYLNVSTGGEDEGSQSRWVCNLPEKSRQLRAHLHLEPLCLCSGRFASAEEAQQQARATLIQARESNLNLSNLEIWSVSQDIGKPIFTLVLRRALDGIHPEKFENLKRLVGADLAPISTKRFQEHVAISPPPQ
jgi:hypothetical protein